MFNRGTPNSMHQRAFIKNCTAQLREECLASARLLDEFRMEKNESRDDQLTMAHIQGKITATIARKTLVRALHQELDHIFHSSQDT